MKKKPYFIFLIFLVLNLIPHAYVALTTSKGLLNWYITDDAFYYFKVAQNISLGRGITFDGIAPTNGFHPLWMLVCIPIFALARLDLYLPLRLLIIVQAILNAGSGYFLYRLFADHISEKAGWLLAFCWMFIPSIHAISSKLGLESGLSIFCIIFFIYRISKFMQKSEKSQVGAVDMLLLGLAGALVLFSRLDNIFMLVMVGLWLVFRGSKMSWISQVDFLLIFTAAVLSYYSRIQTTNNIFNFLPFFYMLVGFSLVLKPVCLFFCGMYELNGKVTLKRFVLKTIVAMTAASLLIGLIFFVLHDLLHTFRGISRAVIILDWLTSTSFVLFFRIFLFWKKHDLFGSQENNLKRRLLMWLKNAAAYFVPLFSLLLLYMTANEIYAGSSMPVSGQIKRWWGTLPNTVYGRPIKTLTAMITGIFSTNKETGPFWLITRPLDQASVWIRDLFSFSPGPTISAFLSGFVWLVLLAVALAIFSRRPRDFYALTRKFALLPLSIGCIFHVISYKATGYMHAKYWYWLEEMILIVLLLGIMLAFLIKDWENQSRQRWLIQSATAIIVFGIFFNFGFTILRDYPMNKEPVDLYDYDADLQFLEYNTQPGDVIGMTGGGVTAYLMPDRVFINLDGLINSSAYFESLKNDRAGEYLSAAGMDYVYGEEQVLLDSDPYRWVFTDHLRLISRPTSQFSFYQYCTQICQ